MKKTTNWGVRVAGDWSPYLDTGQAGGDHTRHGTEKPPSGRHPADWQRVEKEGSDEHEPCAGPRRGRDAVWRNLVEGEEEAVAQRHEHERRYLVETPVVKTGPSDFHHILVV